MKEIIRVFGILLAVVLFSGCMATGTKEEVYETSATLAFYVLYFVPLMAALIVVFVQGLQSWRALGIALFVFCVVHIICLLFLWMFIGDFVLVVNFVYGNIL